MDATVTGPGVFVRCRHCGEAWRESDPQLEKKVGLHAALIVFGAGYKKYQVRRAQRETVDLFHRVLVGAKPELVITPGT